MASDRTTEIHTLTKANTDYARRLDEWAGDGHTVDSESVYVCADCKEGEPIDAARAIRMRARIMETTRLREQRDQLHVAIEGIYADAHNLCATELLGIRVPAVLVQGLREIMADCRRAAGHALRHDGFHRLSCPVHGGFDST